MKADLTTLIALATANQHKAQEISQILAGDFQFLTLADFPGAPAAAEDASSFAGNAIKKASALAQWIVAHPAGLWETMKLRPRLLLVLADDSGLEVDALGGAPGVHSARFAAADAGGGNTPDAANNAKLKRLLAGVPAEKRTARFRCVLALIRLSFQAPSGESPRVLAEGPLLIEGLCEGRIGFAELGAGGFGYDPLFIPFGRAESFAQLDAEAKNSLSHRSIALRKLLPLLGPQPVSAPPSPGA